MGEVKPFKGILYNGAKVDDFYKVVCPPYDVINDPDQEKLYLADEHNAVRIIQGKVFPADTPTDNKYTRAAGYLDQWLKDGVLETDAEPGLYIYQQKFTHKRKQYSRKGFLGLLKLDQKGGIKVHENTYQKPKDDRLELMKATSANTEPIYLIYRGDSVSLPEKSPEIEFKDANNVINRLWKVNDPAEIADFSKDLADVNFYIADGHHRYETANDYARLMKVDPASKDPRNYILAYFVEESDPGLLVLPIHRMLNIAADDVDQIIKTAKKYFLIVEIDSFEKVEKAVGHVFGFCNKKDGKLYMFKLRDVVGKDRIMEAKGSTGQADLEVAILHSLLLDDILEKYKGNSTEYIAYTHDEKEAISQVKKGKYSCSFLMNPTKVSQIMKSDKGGRMPQKSTFFYPKPYSGVVMRRFEA